MKNKLLRGYSLLEVMLSVAIFAIMGSVLFGDTPSIGKSIAFNTEANLITDIVRDVQIKGSSGYVGTSTNSNSEYSGLGLVFFVGKSDSNRINVFADKIINNNERGAYKGNGYYDDSNNNSYDLILANSVENGRVKTDKNSQWNVELSESVINRMWIGDKELIIYTDTQPKASVLFQKGDTKARITDLTVSNIKSTSSPLFIELESKKLSAKSYRCVVIEYSGSARVENGACQSYGSKIETKTINNNTTVQTVRTSSDNSNTPRPVYTPGTAGRSSGNIANGDPVTGGVQSPTYSYNSPISTSPSDPASSLPPSIPATSSTPSSNVNSSEPKVDNDGDGLIDISNINQLNNIRYNLFGTSYKAGEGDASSTVGCPNNVCKGYELMTNLDFNNLSYYGGNNNLFLSIYASIQQLRNKISGWKPIGGDNGTCNYNNAFTGIFDGNGYSINNLYINGESSFNSNRSSYLGLFGCTFGAEIKNLSINEVYIRSGSDYVGGLIGYADNTNISNIKVENKLEYITPPPSNDREIIAGRGNTCAIVKGGAVKCWGLAGLLGVPLITGINSTSTPIEVPNLSGVRSLSIGEIHSCALTGEGTVKCWGRNASGQLGTTTNFGSYNINYTPIRVEGLYGVTAISSGVNHVCVIIGEDSKVKCWGGNNYEQLGTSTNILSTSTPISVEGLSNVKSIALGYNHSCALINDGTVKCWGGNYDGQLGTSTSVTISTPTLIQVSGLQDVKSISAGASHSCALINDGAVKCWGNNLYGQLGTTTNFRLSDQNPKPIEVANLSNVSSLSLGQYHSCALIVGGKVRCWGVNYEEELGVSKSTVPIATSTPIEVSGLSNVRSISTGYYHSCAILVGETVKCWGWNSSSQLGVSKDIVPDSTSTPTIVEGFATIKTTIDNIESTFISIYNNILSYFSNVLSLLPSWLQIIFSPIYTDNININYIYGKNYVGGVIGYGSGVQTQSPVSGGIYHTCALVDGGLVRCWGSYASGRLGVAGSGSTSTPLQVTRLDNVTAIALGLDYSCALINDGTVKCWGYNNYGQLGTSSVSSSSIPIQVSNLGTTTIISLGQQHSCALINDGTVKCWGNNNYGQLGTSTSVSSSSIPIQVTGLSDVRSLSLGNGHTCVLINDGTVKCWGNNIRGQLGTSTSIVSTSTPIKVSGLSNVKSISLKGFSSCALINDGTVKCWGNNQYGQLGTSTNFGNNPSINPTPTTVQSLGTSTSVSLGNGYTCALINDGTVKCWGNNSVGQLGTSTTVTSSTSIPIQVTGLSGVRSLSLGDSHSCVVMNNKTIKCWGWNNNGQLGTSTSIFTNLQNPTPLLVQGLNILSDIYKSSLDKVISIININKEIEADIVAIASSTNRGGIIGGADNVSISDSSYSGYVYGGSNLGGIAGYINNSKISRVVSAGYVTSGTTSPGTNIGRLVGQSDYSIISSSTVSTSTNITPIDIYGKGAIGYMIGLANYSDISNSIVNLYNNNIKTSNGSRSTSTTGVGGIVGVANNTTIKNNAILENIPYTSNIYGTNTNIGGIAGIVSGLSSAITYNLVSGMTVWGYSDKIIGDIFGYKDSNSIFTTGNSTTTYFVKKN